MIMINLNKLSNKNLLNGHLVSLFIFLLMIHLLLFNVFLMLIVNVLKLLLGFVSNLLVIPCLPKASLQCIPTSSIASPTSVQEFLNSPRKSSLMLMLDVRNSFVNSNLIGNALITEFLLNANLLVKMMLLLPKWLMKVLV